jgi:MHS family proline/betaine transporter-like MFS transporter
MLESTSPGDVRAPAAVPGTLARQQRAKKATAAAVFGTLVEYYDFSVYGYVAASLAAAFFPSSNPTASLLNTFLVFGSAFIVRPLGAVFFGHLGDRIGRRTSLLACITMMGIASTLIGLLPTYAQIGVAAPIALVLLRMIQGFSTGGEIGGAASYIREWAPENRRSFYISAIPGVAQLGKGLAAGIAALIASWAPPEALDDWGWRIPFLLSLPLTMLCLYFRLQIEDSPEHAELKRSNATSEQPFRELVAGYWPQLLKVVAIAVVQTTGTYIGTVYVAVYLSEVLSFSKGDAATIVFIAVLCASVLIMIAGHLATRTGPKNMLRASYTAYAVISIPSFMLMSSGTFAFAIAGLVLGMVPYAMCQAGTYSSMPEFFPARIRHSGVAFGHSTGAVIGGAGGPYVATLLVEVTGNILVPSFLLAGAGVAGLLLLFRVTRTPPTSKHLYR